MSAHAFRSLCLRIGITGTAVVGLAGAWVTASLRGPLPADELIATPLLLITLLIAVGVRALWHPVERSTESRSMRPLPS